MQLQPTRQRVSAPRQRLGRRARPGDERQRPEPAHQRLPARRHAAERLHQQPGQQRRRHRAGHGDDPRVPRSSRTATAPSTAATPAARSTSSPSPAPTGSPAAPSSSIATTRSTPATTSTSTRSRASAATSSAARWAARCGRTGCSSSSATRACSRTSAARSSRRVPDDNARRGMLPTGTGADQPDHPAVPARVSASPTARRSATAWRSTASVSISGSTQNFFQGRVDAVPSAGAQFFVRYTLDDAEQRLPTDYPQFPRAFVSRNQFLTAEYRSALSPATFAHRAVRLQPHAHRARPSSRTPRRPVSPFVPGPPTMGAIDIGGVPRFGPQLSAESACSSRTSSAASST